MTRVLITGGAGFIGYHLARELVAEGYKVDLLDDLSRGVLDSEFINLTTDPKVTLLNRDLLHRNAFEGLEGDYHYIYHFAAIIGVENVLKDPYAVISENALMLINLFDFVRQQLELRRFVFTSTSEVYAGTLKFFDLPIPTPESVPLAITELSQPRTSYMLSKIFGEALCQYSDIAWTIIRPHNVYGPRMGLAHVIPQLLDKAHHAKNGCLEVFSVEHRRTFCYIADAVAMIKRAAESEVCVGETLNVGTQAPEITIGQLADIIINVVKKPLKIVPQPAISGSPIRRCPDMTKTIALTEYIPRVSLETDVGLTYDWYKAHIFEGEELSAN